MTATRPRLSFEAEGHLYLADGKRMQRSCTGVIKDVGLAGNYRFRDPIHAFRGVACHEGSAIIIAGGEPHLAPLPDKLPGVSQERHAEYVKVHGEIPGYWEAVRRAKAAIGFTGTIYECGFISVPDGLGGKLDFCAWVPTAEQLWDIKSGTWPVMTVVQICGYEYLAAKGLPIDPEHAGLDWLLEVVNSGRKFERCGLLIEKTGRFTAHYETNKGQSFQLPLWMTLWRSALAIHKLVPGHEYVTEDSSGYPQRESRLADTKWLVGQIKEHLTGPNYEICMRAGENIFNVRQQYNLL